MIMTEGPPSMHNDFVHDKRDHRVGWSQKPVRPKRTQPVLPESLTATISARSPFLKIPIELAGLLEGALKSCLNLSQMLCLSVGDASVFARVGRAYCGPIFLTGPFGSSGSS